MSSNTFKEDEIGRRWDRCIVNGIVKLGAGISVGLVCTIILPLRVPMVIMGAGLGLGMAYTSCERDMNQAVRDRIYEKLAREQGKL